MCADTCGILISFQALIPRLSCNISVLMISSSGGSYCQGLYKHLPNFMDPGRVLAKISKMPVQNSNFNISARPDLATYLIQIPIPATIYSLVCHKGQFTLQLCPRRWFVGKIFFITTQKSKLKNLHRNFCLSKQEVFRKLSVQKTGRTGPG